MKSSAILREAAADLESGINADCGACYAVKHVLLRHGYESSAATDAAYGYLYPDSPMRHMHAAFDFEGFPILWPYGYKSRDQGPRIIGLCLAAAIAESEGD